MSSRTKRYLPLLLTTALVTYTAHHAAHAQEAWSQFNTEHGSISIDTSTINQTLINQSGNLYIGSSNNLNINANQSVTIGQDNNDALFVAKAQNGSDPTRILGTLQTRTKDASGAFTNSVGGSVMILDGNGVFFGRDAVIDSHGIVASTGQVDNNELINAVNTKGGRVSLSNFGNGAIVNEGTISVSDGGLAAFVAPNVVNNGIITARAGRVELVGANTKSTVDLYGDGLVEIEVNDSNTEKLLVENKGTIDAAGGVVHLTTGAAERIVDSVINMDGVITASSVTQKGGKIVLGGAKTGQVNVGGTVTADGATGGGEVTVKAAEVTVKAAAEVSASATQNGDGGTVLFLGRDLAILNGRVRARGGSQGGNGGFVELSSDRDFQIAGNVDTTALHGKSGVFLIDPRDLAILIGTRPGGVTSGLYESDIEALSVTTDIDLLARRNITVSADVTGFSDGIINIANGHNLTIRTTNAPYFAITFNPFQVITEVDNSGSIDLTGNTTYGKNLEWKTTGNGSISILGATDNLFSSNIKVGKLITDAGSVTVDTDNGKVEINGGIATNGGAVNVNSTLRTTIASQIATNGGSVTLTGNNNSASNPGVEITSAGSVNSAGGNVAMTSSNAKVQIDGAVNAGAGDVTLQGNSIVFNNDVTADDLNLTSSSTVSQTGGKITGDVLAASATGSIALNAAANDLNSLGNITASALSLTDADDLALTGTVATTGNGNVSLTTGGALAVNGTLNAGNGNISLTADSITQGASGKVTGNTLSGLVQQSANLNSTTNDLNGIGNFTTAAASGSYGGFTYNDADDIALNGTIVTGGQSIIVGSQGAMTVAGSLQSNGGHTVLNSNNANLTVTGTINSGAGDVGLTSAAIALNGSSSVTAGNRITLSGASVSQDLTSKIAGELLSATTTGAVSLTGTNNDINTLGTVNASSFALNDVDGLTVDGNVTTTGGNVSIKGNGTAFNATGNVAINAGKTIASNGGDITVDASASGLIVRGNVNAGSGDATLKGRQVQLNGSSAVTADNVDLTTMLVSQQANSQVIANTLTGTVQQTASLTGTNNDVGSIGNFATGLGSGVGGFTFNDVNGVNVSGAVSTDGGAVSITSHGATSLDNGGSIASNGGNVTFNSNGGSLAVDGTLDAGAGDVSLTAASISQASTGKVLGDDLTVQSAGSVVLNSAANDVDTLGTVNAASFRFRDADDLTVAGDVTTTGGIAAIRSNGLTVNGDIASGNGNITLNGGTGALAINSDINAGTGDIALNGSTVLLNATSVVSGDEVDVTAGLLSQDIAGKIAGRKLTGQIQQTASLLGTDNDLDVIGDFGTGLDGSAGGFAYNDVDGVDVNGDVTTNGGDIDVTAQSLKIRNDGLLRTNGGAIDLALTGDLTVNGRINAGSGDLTVGATTVALNDGSVVRADDIAITADRVTQGATGKIVADTLTAQVQNGLSLTGTDNDLAALNDIETAAGDIAFNDVNGVVIDGDITTQGGTVSITGNGASAGATRNVILNAGKTVASNGGDITLAANGANLVIDGSVAGGNGTTDLSGSVIRLKNGSTVDSRRVNVSGGSLQQGVNSVLTTNRLTGALQEDAVFNGRNNDVATLGDFATGLSASHKGGLTLVDENGLNIVGAVTSDSTGASGTGAIDIATKGGALTFTGTSSVVTEGGDLNIASNRRINIRQGAVIDLQNGNAFVDAPRVNLGADIGTTGTIDGTAAIVNVLNDTAQIQDGVDVAANNATVNVSAGNYTGNVVVDKTLNLYGAQAGVDARNRTGLSETVVSGAFGFDVQADNTLIDGFEITNGAGSGPLTDGVRVNGAANVTVQNNKITGMNGAAVSSNSFLGTFTSGLKVLTNWFSGNGSGANLSNSDNALVQNNLVEGNTGAGIRIFGSNGSTIDNNELNGNGIGIEVAGDNGVSTDVSSDTLIQSNVLNANTVGIKTTGNGASDVIIADNLLTDNTTGMLFEGGEIDISTLTAPNQITGGTTGIHIDRTLAGNPVSLTNNSLGSTIFDGQSGNYVELANGALSGATIDGLAASFDGVVPLNSVLGAGLLTAVDRLAIESKLFDFDDDNGLGQILVGLNLNADEKDLFSLGLYSLQPQTGNVRVTIAGLPRVSLTSNVSLAAISPAAGVNARFASASDLANIETAAGGDDNGADLASVEPAAGGENGCWASADSANLGAQVVNFSFGPDVNSAIKDSSCAD